MESGGGTLPVYRQDLSAAAASTAAARAAELGLLKAPGTMEPVAPANAAAAAACCWW